MGPAYFVANLIPCVILWRLYGWNGLMRTVVGAASFSVWLSVTAPLQQFAPTHNPLLAVVYAGALLGLSVGLVVRVGGSTGGTDTIAQVVRHFTGMDVGKFMLIADIIILGLGAIFLGVEAVMYGMLVTVIMTQVLQTVVEGFLNTRCLLIISEQPDTVGKAILAQMKRGVTRLAGTGEYSGRPRPVLMCVVEDTEVMRIKKIVLQADPEAFIITTDARDVSGKGFTLNTEIRPLSFWRIQRGL